MALSDDDVREILRLIDESELDELQVETRGFKLHVRRGGAPPEAAEEPSDDPAPAAEPSPPGGGAPKADAGSRIIEAPMLGTFYAADGPGAEPFVEVGAKVEPETVVCIIEVMKMMNSVRAGIAGTIVEVCAENAEQVEEGQPLFRVKST